MNAIDRVCLWIGGVGLLAFAASPVASLAIGALGMLRGIF